MSAVQRIASLLPSTTEIVCALGFEGALVGRSHECDFPASVRALPSLTEPKLDATAGSRVIDDRVKWLVREGLSVYRVDADRLAELAPTAILTQDQCEVCAASRDDVERALEQWTGTRPQVLSVDPRTVDDVLADVRRVGEALGDADGGAALSRSLSERLDAVAARAPGPPGAGSVACVEWIDPLMAAGNWMPELVERLGARSAFGRRGEPSPWLDWEALRAADPDVIVVLPCGFDLPRVRREIGPLLARPGFSELRAVRREEVYLVDGHQYMNRPGPRIVESLEILAEILHPGTFPPRHRGEAWQRL